MPNKLLHTPPNGHFLRSNGPIILNDGSPLLPTFAGAENTGISNSNTTVNSAAALATDKK